MVRGLEAALWAFRGAQDYREAVLKAVDLGDDADTSRGCLRATRRCVLGRERHSEGVAGEVGKTGHDREALTGLVGKP